jgi:hypothetical protein
VNYLPSPDIGRGGQGSAGGMVQVINISAVDAFSLKRMLEGEGQTLSEIVANQIPGSYSMSNVLGG